MLARRLLILSAMSTKQSPLPFDKLPVRMAPSLDLLSGVKVLDLTSSVAGPYAGQLLADMGATVVKIEKPGSGDDARAWGPPFLHGESLWFMSVNRGKHSVALDFSQPEGLAVLHQLIVHADAIIVNLVARSQKKLGVDAQRLRAINPQLIHVSLTGFGLTGARADMPCYDLIAEGYSSVMDLTGEPDGPPQKVGTPAADMLAGHDAAMSLLAALYRRERTGVGCEIDVAMVQSMSRFMAPRIMPYLGSGDVTRRSGGRDSVIAVYQVFETADEPMTLGLGNDAIWKRFWEAVGQPEVAANPAYASNAQRREHRPAIVQEIAQLLKQKPRAHWLALLVRARVPAGPIHRVDELVQDQALQEAGFIYQCEGPDGCIPQVGLGILFDGVSEGTAMPPPKLGAHTQAILQDWLGCSPAAIEQLQQKKVI